MIANGSVYLVSHHFERSLDFYRALLQKDVVAQNQTRFAVFDAGGLCLCVYNALFDAENPEKVIKRGTIVPRYDDTVSIARSPNSRKVFLNLGTDDLKAEYDRIKALKIGTHLTEIRYLNAAMPYWYFHLCDPDGNPVEITGPYAE